MNRYTLILLSLGVVAVCSVALAEKERPVLEKALAGPLAEVKEIIFVTRASYDDGHWYANIGYYCDDENKKACAGNGKPDVGKIYTLDIRTGEATVLFDAQGGSVRDPQIHYDGTKILFSLRRADTDYYHLCEINTDGSGFREITTGPYNDFEAIYLPDGEILFVSTRCKRWVNCWMTQVATLFRCDANGGNIRPVSGNTEHDNTPWVMPDGRILYTRWEYVDRSQVDFHHLWTMNPDGSDQQIFYGNMHPGTVMIDAKPIPGTDQVLATFSPGHGRNEHRGPVAIVDSTRGPDDPEGARIVLKKHIQDPYPLSEDCFLVAQDRIIFVADAEDNTDVIFRFRGEGAIHEPRPIMRRPRERVLATRADFDQSMAELFLADIYIGRNMVGVARGDVKKLLILELLPKPVNFSGGPDLLSWLGTFTLQRVMGVVPVEEDGSAYFKIPANRSFFFVALDENDLAVKRMQSFLSLTPGERLSCVGCHESRLQTHANPGRGVLLAAQRPPSTIERFEGFPDVIDFNRDIQPILDKHCVECHNFSKREGHVSLVGDLGPTYSHSFYALYANLQVADGRNGLGNQPPRSIGLWFGFGSRAAPPTPDPMPPLETRSSKVLLKPVRCSEARKRFLKTAALPVTRPITRTTVRGWRFHSTPNAKNDDAPLIVLLPCMNVSSCPTTPLPVSAFIFCLISHTPKTRPSYSGRLRARREALEAAATSSKTRKIRTTKAYSPRSRPAKPKPTSNPATPPPVSAPTANTSV